VEDICDYKKNWTQFVEKMQRNILPRLAVYDKFTGAEDRAIPQRDGKDSSWE
jgi:hypothetical protein